ncbi:NAD-dependent deacylase [Neobacillus notoginsengisoli]|uniref:NAD-dependent deacylase n=1 Tax=Neobacillus notoginsengisoli TaxID=1578198 RepID=UPI003B84A4AC
MLRRLFDESSYTVVFTGAGMSTEAGLPDFRSASTGLWNNIDPMELASTDAMYNNREAFIDFYRYRVESLRACTPHKGHEILAKWGREGKVKSIITQNVDGFHHLAGSESVAELHGTLRTCHCNDCRRRYPIDNFMELGTSCECCGFLRPSVVLFGEELPEDAFIQAEREAKKADLFVAIGSSLTVSPANLFPQIAKQAGAKLVIINIEKTGLDHLADLIITNEKIGSILQQLE